MKCYMNYSIEELMEYRNYKKVCEIFFSLAKDDVILKKLKEILYYGKRKDYSFKSKFECRQNPLIEISRRIGMASICIRNPETFTFFEQNNINIFHGTNANALPNILKYGLNSHETLIKEGIPVLTGEKSTRSHINRQFISFTDVLDTAEEYSRLSSQNGAEDLSFSVILGVSEKQMSKAKITAVHSEFSEIGVMQHFPIESIGCICVPVDKIEFVKKMMINYQIPVLGISDLNKKAYYIEEWQDFLIFPELYESKSENSWKFSFVDIKEMTMSRSLFKMKEFLEKMKNGYKKEKKNENERNHRFR